MILLVCTRCIMYITGGHRTEDKSGIILKRTDMCGHGASHGCLHDRSCHERIPGRSVVALERRLYSTSGCTQDGDRLVSLVYTYDAHFLTEPIGNHTRNNALSTYALTNLVPSSCCCLKLSPPILVQIFICSVSRREGKTVS